MSKLYSIQESTLTNIGNALRSKYGETRIEIERMPPFILIKSSRATDFNTYGGYTGPDTVHVFKCPGANYIKLVYTTNINDGGNYIKYAIGEYTKSTFPTDGIVLENATEPNIITIEADTITIRVYDVSWKDRGYYIQATGYDAANNPIELEGSTIIEKEVEVKNTYSSADVAAAIEGLSTTPEPIVLSGDQPYGCAGILSSAYINMYGNTITTNELTNDCSYMFYNSILEEIPFDINTKSSSAIKLDSIFDGCKYLKTVPQINYAKPTSLGSGFRYCYCLREIPDNYFNNWDFSYVSTQTSAYTGNFGSMFWDCRSLRRLPLTWLKNMNPQAVNSYSYFYYGFINCYTLDELIKLPIPYTKAIWTSNVLNTFVTGCSRLKNLTFETNEDGSPIVVQWKNQVLQLNSSGFCSISKGSILDYNSGITADKEVIDDATYQALKDDPDWFTCNANYSRYNHDSAVATINSLPDTSAYLTANGGTNTIKFKGAAGLGTDGGAINTLTEEEIAVAAAKGWTVSLA